MTSHLFKEKYPKFIGSSVDPYKLSLTIKGILAAIVPLILVLAPMFHWTVNGEDFKNLDTAIEAIIIGITSIFSASMIIWGILRKILVAVGIIKSII